MAVFLWTGCGGGEPEPDSPVVARFKEKTLTERQLDYYIPEGLTPEDSARFANQFVDRWIREQAVMEKALEDDPELLQKVNFKVEDYRAKLIMHEFHGKLMEQGKAAEVPETELRKYYEENKENFRSKEPQYSYFFLVTTEKEGLDEVVSWMRSSKEEDIQQLREWTRDRTLEVKLDSNYVKETQIVNDGKGYFGNIKNVNVGQLIRWNGVIQGVRRRYFFKMLDEVEVGDYLPFSLCKEKINSLLRNERQVQLIDETEQKIIKDAQANNYIRR